MPHNTTVIAVSKGQPVSAITPLLLSGHRHFAENRVQEAEEKWPALKTRYPDVVLHMIGPLQTNKARKAVALFDVIQTLDREELAKELAKEMARQGRDLPCFIQVNTGQEPQKAGVSPQHAADFLKYCREIHGLQVTGLMCIPPAEENPAPHFAFLNELARRLGLRDLSMGMSKDYETAKRFGATYVRLGQAIFGERQG